MNWKSTFRYLPVHFNMAIGTLEQITQRTFFRNNLTGNKVRIRFSNRYGEKTLILDEVVLGNIQHGKIENAVQAMYKKRTKIILEPGEEFYSDEIDFCCLAGTSLAVSVYIGAPMPVMSACTSYSKGSWYTVYEKGGRNMTADMEKPLESRDVFPYAQKEIFQPEILVGISEIQVWTEDTVRTVCVFGDSITHMSCYSDALSEALYRKYPGKITVVNCGIGGNRILRDSAYIAELPGNNVCAGEAAVKRFEKDIFGTGTPDVILFLEGVNDLMHPYFLNRMEELPSCQEMKEGIQKLVQTAHRYGSRIYLGTILPFWSENGCWGQEGEDIRREINGWMKTQNIADGVIDFDAATADREMPVRMKPEYHLGDGLHPNHTGGKAMADEVMKEIFSIDEF